MVLSVLQEAIVEVAEAVRALLDRLPDECSLDEDLYHLYV
jgi:hypothetical protein